MITSAEDYCGNIECSNVLEYVCGMARALDGTTVISKHHNICHMMLTRCQLESIVEITQVPDELCHIRNQHKQYSRSGRRLNDFSVVGAHQACNHICPTYCVDTYEPACAQIWARDMKSKKLRPMINHCHIDLLSCALGVNVTIQPLGKCYKNPTGLLFMSNVAAMKSLKLLDDVPVDVSQNTKLGAPTAPRRRSNDDKEWLIEDLLYNK
ncbi:Uncharacterized protein OBRU01_07084 [Operophtera brumata]|uniref:Uncharacterized protein n=1 Tax=Operophtera brumata TaxID=104452 RepID=A0A0L7LD24_OPEBR|nr:Uncharacterized protein OBRU01_07084 [Operophtera brumata]